MKLGLSFTRKIQGRILRRSPETDLVIPVRGLNLPAPAIIELIRGIEEAKLLAEVREGSQPVAGEDGD